MTEFISGRSEAHTFYVFAGDCKFKNSNLSNCKCDWATFGRIDSNLIARNLNFADCNHSSYAILLYYSIFDLKNINFINFYSTDNRYFGYYGRGSRIYFSDTLFMIYECELFFRLDKPKNAEYFEIRNSILVFNFTLDSSFNLINVSNMTSPISQSLYSLDFDFNKNYCIYVNSCRNQGLMMQFKFCIHVFIFMTSDE